MTAPILIFAIGNESRGDDALAPLLLRQIERNLSNEAQAGRFELIEEFQLQVEHAMDMLGRELLLFIDAGMDTPAPYSFYRVKQDDERPLFSHALTPAAVSATYRQLYRQPAPPAFVLCIKGEQFELGAPPSPQALRNMASALALMQQLTHEPQASVWERLCLRENSGEAAT